MSEATEGLSLSVRAAEKRDAGRGVARVSEAVRRELGALSGDPIVIEGQRATIARLWPADPGLPDAVVQIDADTRANAGVTVGDAVTVQSLSDADIEPAERVVLAAPGSLSAEQRVRAERAATRSLRNRPVRAGEQVRLERIVPDPFAVVATEPDGDVRVAESTDVSVREADGRESSAGASTTADGGPVGGRGDSTGDATSEESTGTDMDARTGAEPDTGTKPDPDTGTRPDPDARSRTDPDTGTRPDPDPGTGADAEGDAAPSGGAASDATGEGEPTPPDRPGRVTYEDIGGLDEELELVREMIELPLSEPELFHRLGVEPPTGVLLHGPPGTGKTLIARAVANEVDATFLTIDGPEIVSKYKGQSEERLRETFERARAEAPTILFFDEIDSIAGARDDDSDAENRIVGQLLTLMDGLAARGQVIVIGATNRVDTVDPALRRGGRFDREIQIGVPDREGRREILEVHTRGMPLAEDVDLEAIASRTHGFVGADLDALTSEAAMAAVRRRPADPEKRDAWNAEPEVTKADFETALAKVEPSAMREFVAESPTVDFGDVGGLEDAKATLREAVEWPLTYEALFERANTDPPTGVLLHGPPGTGKTLLARALAGETEVNFVRVDGPEIMDRYVGESERAVRDLFERARQAAPSIVFLDEIDAIVGHRGGEHEVTERVISQLLTEIDAAAENPNLTVLAATNRIEDLDAALLRPGRLDTHVFVGEPDLEGRTQILAVHTRGKPLAEDVDLDALAAELEGYTGADLAGLVRDAAMRAIREVAAEVDPAEAAEYADEVRIELAHLEAARAAIEDGRMGAAIDS